MDLKKIRDRCREDGDCWIWAQGVNSAGYPQASIDGKGGQMVRRAALIAAGKLPKGKANRVTDICGNRLCCNPEHLKWASFSDLLKGAYRSGNRSTVQEYLKRFEAARKNGMVKLDWDRVNQIRARCFDEPTRVLAAEFGVGTNAIRAIKFNRSWRVASPWR